MNNLEENEKKLRDPKTGTKNRDLLLVLVLLFLAGGLFLGQKLIRAKTDGNELIIQLDGKTFGTYSLDEDRVIEIGNGNRCEIRDGFVSMIWADCPDEICVHSKPIGRSGGSIICLPHKVVLRISHDGTQEVDMIAG